MTVLLFVHFLGFALWIGGGWSTMALVIRSRKDTPATRMGLFRILPAAFGVIAIGALLTVLSGLGLAAALAQLGLSSRLGEPGVTIMMGAGLLAAVVMLVVGLPTARTLSRLAAGDQAPPEFERYRKRLAASSSVSGALGLIALIGTTLVR